MVDGTNAEQTRSQVYMVLKGNRHSLTRTSALDFNKEGCVIQIRAD